MRATLIIGEPTQRTLQPCVPTRVIAAARVDLNYVFTWYRT